MTGPLRVLLLDLWCTVPYYTGALGKGLEECGAEVRVACPVYDLDPEYFRRMGLRNQPGPLDFAGRRRIAQPALRRALKGLEWAVNSAALSWQCRRRPFDIVHVQQFGLAQSGIGTELGWLRRLARSGSRVVYTVHNVLPHDTGRRHLPLFSEIYHFADALICHSGRIKEQVSAEFGIEPGRIHAIPHGLLFAAGAPPFAESRARWQLEPRHCAVLWQGFVKDYKGIPFLLEAWKRVEAVSPDAVLIVAGGGDPQLLDSIREQARGMKSVRTEMRYLDHDEVASLYSAADVAVYPYREITTSGALMTGIAAKKALVATELPAFSEVLEDGVHGRLVPYGDVDALAGALLELIGNPAARSAYAAASAGLATELSWDRIAERTLRCYRETLEAPARVAGQLLCPTTSNISGQGEART